MSLKRTIKINVVLISWKLNIDMYNQLYIYYRKKHRIIKCFLVFPNLKTKFIIAYSATNHYREIICSHRRIVYITVSFYKHPNVLK